MSPIKNSRIMRTAFINILMGVLLVLIFVISTLSLSSDLTREREMRSQHLIESFADNFVSETNNLRDSITLTKSSNNFIMLTASDYVAWKDLRDYAKNTISILTVMQSTLPNVLRVILTAPRIGDAFSGSGMIDLDQISKSSWIKGLLYGDEKVPDFTEISDGWHGYNNFSFYVQHGFSGSAIVAVVRSSGIAALNTFNKAHPDQHVVVLDKEGKYFTSSFNTVMCNLPNSDQFCTLQTNDNYSFDGVDYEIRRIEREDFTFLLLNNRITLESAYATTNVAISIMVLGVLLVLSVTMLNTFLFARINRSLGSHKTDSDEIKQIERMVEERSEWHKQELARFVEAVGRKSATEKDFAAICGTITEEYDRWFVLCITLQNVNRTITNDLFLQLERFLNDHFTCHGAVMSKGRAGYIIERCAGSDRIEEMLEQFCQSLPDNVRGWAGISTSYSEPLMMRRAFEQAINRMMFCPLKRNRRLSFCDNVCRNVEKNFSGVSIIDEIANCLYERDQESAEEKLDELFFDGEDYTLKDMQSIGEEIAGRIASHIPNGEAAIVFSADDIYHPSVLFNELSTYALEVSDAVQRIEMQPKAAANVSDTANSVVQWIQEHYQEDISLELVADQFNITPYYLSYWFKKENNINFSVFLSALRINHARELLEADSTLKNSEIGEKVGIPNMQTFTRQFKAQIGMTPDQYRKQLRGERNE